MVSKETKRDSPNLKVAVVAAPYLPVPPKYYGGAERRINSLVDYLGSYGIDVDLLASGDSYPSVPLKPIHPQSLTSESSYDHSRDRMSKLREINKKTLDIISKGDYDLVNTHDYENPDLIEGLSNLSIPSIVSVRHSLTPLIRDVYENFKDEDKIYFHGVSRRQADSLGQGLDFIHHGEETHNYQPLVNSDNKRNYFFSIGDMKPLKGHKAAIDLAKKSGVDLVLSGGSLYFPDSEHYFENVIKPHIDENVYHDKVNFLKGLVSGKRTFGQGRIINFGPSNDREKNILYRHALFTQFLGGLELDGGEDACPGTIMESLLSGTPVLGYEDSVSYEMVKNGLLGKNVSSLEEAASSIEQVSSMDPLTISRAARKKYSAQNMALKYSSLYRDVLGM